MVEQDDGGSEGRGTPVPAGAESRRQERLVELLDRRIAESTPEDALYWTRNRGEIIAQDELPFDRKHARRIETARLRARIVLSALAIVAGTALILAGSWEIGAVALGSGLYYVAPELMREISKRVAWPGRDDHDP